MGDTIKEKADELIEGMSDYVPIVNIIGLLTFFGFLQGFYGDECNTTRIIVQWSFIGICGFIIGPYYHYLTMKEINNGSTTIERLKNKKVVPWKYMLFQFFSTWVYLLGSTSQPIQCHLKKDSAKGDLYIIQFSCLLLLTIIFQITEGQIYKS